MSDTLENLDITREELNVIGECMKKEEFRQLLNDYVKEVTDPENRKKYQDDIIQLEKERGVDVTFLNPNPGFVIKTSQNGNMKVFINICTNENVQKPTSQVTHQDGKRGLNWALPYAQAPPVKDLDKNNARCIVYDVLFHPDSLKMAHQNKEFKNLLIKTALEAVENNFDVKLDKLNIKFPKLAFKGIPRPTVIRKKSLTPPTEDIIDLKAYGCPYQTLEESEKLMEIHKEKVLEKQEKEKDNLNKQEKKFTTPKYIIKQRNNLDIQDYTNERNAKLNCVFPKELAIEISLPLISSANEINLDIEEKRLLLESKLSAKYYLDLNLPFTVNEQEGSAKFDKATKKLTVVLLTKQRPLLKEHSNESDSGCPHTDSSEDEQDKNQAYIGLEEISSSNFISEDSLQTKEINNSVCKTFLDSSIGYTFPTFACNSLDDQICFIIHIKNIDPSSLDYLLTDRTLHLKFHSIASGYFPQHYAFFLQLSERAIILKDNVSHETWDNNLTLTIKFDNFSNIGDSYFVGLDQESITKHYFNEANAIIHKFKELEVLSDDSISDDEIEDQINSTQLNNQDNSPNGTEIDEITEENKGQESKVLNTLRPFQRSYSESSFDEMNNPRPKGILKLSRSISESSSGFEDHLANYNSEGETKKTVRFNNFVKQQLFRPTSSILGQRKKNQKRRQNKRSRKNSESENSDIEINNETTVITERFMKNNNKSSEQNEKQVCKKKQDRKQRNKNKNNLKPQLNIPPNENLTNVDM